MPIINATKIADYIIDINTPINPEHPPPARTSRERRLNFQRATAAEMMRRERLRKVEGTDHLTIGPGNQPAPMPFGIDDFPMS